MTFPSWSRAVRHLLLAGATALGALLGPAPARADGWSATWLPGAAREVPRTTSASRDTAVLGYAIGTHAYAWLGLEPGVVRITRGGETAPTHAFDVGLYGLVALQSQEDAEALPNDYWRGLVGVTFTYAPLGLATRLFGLGAALEVGFVVGHESDHRSDASPGLGALGQSSVFQNFIGGDLGWRIPIGLWLTTSGHLAHRLNAGGVFVQAASVDLDLRLVASRRFQPFVAGYGDVFFTSDRTPNCPAARALVGVALPGRFGELSPFASFEGGCDKGLLFRNRAFRAAGGLRYTPF